MGKNPGKRSCPAEYVAWIGMKRRCLNPCASDYPRYGGRGIMVCQEWVSSFDAFYNYLGPRPGSAYSLGRIDNNGNYEPGNVRWETVSQQARNKSTTNFITFNGITLPRAGWSDSLGLSPTVIKSRLQRGWSVEKALTTPPDHGNESLKSCLSYNGTTRTLHAWAESLGLTHRALRKRLKNGWSVGETLTTPSLGRHNNPA